MHPACLWTTHAGLVLTRDEYVARNTGDVEWRAQDVTVEQIHIEGDAAIVLGVAHDVVVVQGVESRFTMRLTLVWHRGGDAQWRLLAAHVGPRL